MVFLTQDAIPADENWLVGLLAGFARDPLAVAVWSRHIPQPDCHPMESRILEEYPPFTESASVIQAFTAGASEGGFSGDQCSLSNNAAAYARPFLLEHPFPEIGFAEDRAWARQVLDAGWHTFLARDSIIRHSHAYSAWMNLRRNFDHARSLAMDFGHRDDFGLFAGWLAAFREARLDLVARRNKTHEGRLALVRQWGGPAVLYHLGAFAGRWLGAHSLRFPRRMVRWLSLHEASRPDGVEA